MDYKESLLSSCIFNARETRRKQKLFNKKLGKAWHNKKEYATLFFTKKKSTNQKKDITVEKVSTTKNETQKEKDYPLGRLAVYTCVFGGYDNIQDPLLKSEHCDYFIISDKTISKKSKWKQIVPKELPQGFDDWHPAIKNRYFKMHPDIVFPEYKYSLYIDGNIRPVTDLYPFLIEMNNKKKMMGLFQHPICKDVYEMTELLKKISLVDCDKADLQMERYKAEGFSTGWGLFECNLILRMHNEQLCKDAMDTWWEEYLNGEKRDQMCFAYALWKNGMQFEDVCCFGKNIRHNSRLKLREHNWAHSKVEQK